MLGITLKQILFVIQHSISFAGVLVILSGVLLALCKYLSIIFTRHPLSKRAEVNDIRMSLGRTLILGLEFIVAADLIGTTTTPDYYALGMLAIIVLIRTVLSFSLNRELMDLRKQGIV